MYCKYIPQAFIILIQKNMYMTVGVIIMTDYYYIYDYLTLHFYCE